MKPHLKNRLWSKNGREEIKCCEFEAGKKATFNSTSNGAIPSFWLAIFDLSTPRQNETTSQHHFKSFKFANYVVFCYLVWRQEMSIAGNEPLRIFNQNWATSFLVWRSQIVRARSWEWRHSTQNEFGVEWCHSQLLTRNIWPPPRQNESTSQQNFEPFKLAHFALTTHAHTLTGKQTDGRTDRQAGRQTGRQTENRQSDRQRQKDL